MYGPDDSFCELADVAGMVGRGPFTTDTIPPVDDVLRFMALRSARAQAALAQEGLTFTVPSGAAPLSEDADPDLYRLCREFAALAAAGDAVAAAAARDSDEPPGKAVAFWGDAKDHLPLIQERARKLAAKSVCPSSFTAGTGGALPPIPEAW